MTECVYSNVGSSDRGDLSPNALLNPMTCIFLMVCLHGRILGQFYSLVIFPVNLEILAHFP